MSVLQVVWLGQKRELCAGCGGDALRDTDPTPSAAVNCWRETRHPGGYPSALHAHGALETQC